MKDKSSGIMCIMGLVYRLSHNCLFDIREIKIHVYRKRQTSDSSWEFLRIENKQKKIVPNDSYG